MPGRGIFEIVSDYDGDTFRSVYTVKLDSYIYVLHCFQKKSKSGKSIPKADLALIEARYKLAKEDHAQRIKQR